MVAYGKGNNQYSIRKKIYEKIRVIGNIKAMWIVFSKKQNYKKKEKLMIPKISRTFQAQVTQKPKVKLQWW